MFGPGAYRPDPTEGITAIADLPPPEIVSYSRNDKRQPCPRCGHAAYRDKQLQRTLHDLGHLDLWCPRELVVTYSQHYCTVHIVAEVNKAVLGAVASARKGLAATQPKLPKGRPSTQAAKAAARTKKRLATQGAALFTHRYLFVQRHLNKIERKTLWRVSRGLPQLHALRAVMDQVYALFDRRCRTQTALDKLAKLRCRLQRFRPLGETLKKLFSPTLEKALTFLDDKLLPSTSNAVERGNRRYRKRQKSVYRVRNKPGSSATVSENPRNRKHTKRGRKRLFNAVIHALRMHVERTFAWEDKFKRLLLRFERIQQRHYGMKLIAYTLINLRAFCGV